jgi:hypothetical protein
MLRTFDFCGALITLGQVSIMGLDSSGWVHLPTSQLHFGQRAWRPSRFALLRRRAVSLYAIRRMQ